jgi:hypothetical protein
MKHSTTRRAMVCAMGAGSFTALSQPGHASAAAVAREVGRKMNADGSVRRFEGNTFVGHLPSQGSGFAFFDTLLDLYREWPKWSFRSKLAMLPPSSYHITVFGGLNEDDRGRPRWPAGVPADLPIDVATSTWQRELEKRPRPPPQGFSFRLDAPPQPMSDGAPFIPLLPADPATAQRLRELRDSLSALTGIRRADHDSYQYHVTLGYLHAVLDGVESAELQAAIARCMGRLPRVVHVPQMHLCRFKDMYAFETLHPL